MMADRDIPPGRPASGLPPPPLVRVSIGITGHRAAHIQFAENSAAIERALGQIFDCIDAAVVVSPTLPGSGGRGATRLNSMLVDGTDRIAAQLAVARGWELVSPLPFGSTLNAAINALPRDVSDCEALLAGRPAADPDTRERAEAIHSLTGRSRLFALADQDEAIARLLLARFRDLADRAAANLFTAESSRRVALAGRVMIEQSDILIGVWDGVTTAHVGGTGHTIAAALEQGAPVVWVNARAPEQWRILRAPEALATCGEVAATQDHATVIASLVGDVLRPAAQTHNIHAKPHPGLTTLEHERWHPRSNPLWHGYRRIEALFGSERGKSPFRSIAMRYEPPEAIATGSGAPVLAELAALPGADQALADQVEASVLRRFAWADGVSAHLSDAYRGGMVVNFLLSSFAIVAGISYLPFVSTDEKWLFAAFELLLLVVILGITWLGQSRRWHGRWFETRRVAEYLRHSPLLLALGVARAPGRWPRGAETSWPEWYVRQALRDIGLPSVAVTTAYLRSALTGLLGDHVIRQRDYHFDKARRLTTIHHNLDRFSEFLFKLAVGSVVVYLLLISGTAMDLVGGEAIGHAAKYFTVFGVLFPTFGGAIAGIRFFGDFERFAAISEVTAEKLDAVHNRIVLLAAAPDDALDYGRVAELAHATDEIVVAEIENWQAVFGGKQITVPV